MHLGRLIMIVFFLNELWTISGETVVTNIGEDVQLICKFSPNKIQRIQWLFYSPTKVENIIYDSYLNQTSNDYTISYITGDSYCNITIHKVSNRNAGTYNCTVAESLQAKSTLVKTFDLVVGDLKCFSTLNGKNCNENHPNILRKKCSANLYGNVDEKFQLSWVGKKANGIVVVEDHVDVQYFHTEERWLKCETEDEFEMTLDMDGMTFECQVNNFPQIKPCSLQYSLQYASPPELNHLKINRGNLVNVTCNVTKTTSVTCSYLWKYRTGNELLESPNQLLTVENMKHSGIYTCMVTCKGNSMKNCKFKAMTIEVVETASLESLTTLHFLYNLMVIIALSGSLLAAVICIFILCLQRSRYKTIINNKAYGKKILNSSCYETININDEIDGKEL